MVVVTQITENLREELEQRLKVGAEGKAKLSTAMADWYTTKITRMADLDVHPVVVLMEEQVVAINESVQTARNSSARRGSIHPRCCFCCFETRAEKRELRRDFFKAAPRG